MGCFAPDPPDPVNYGQQTRDTLQAQIDLAPQLYASEAQYQPLYGNLALSNLNKILMGSAGGQENYTTTSRAGQAGWYGADGTFLSPGTLNQPGGGGGVDPMNPWRKPTGQVGTPFYSAGNAPQPGAIWRNAGDTFDVTRTRTTEATPGVFELLRRQNTNQRQSDIADVESLGLRAHDAMLAANPESAALLAKLNAQAQTGLDAGSQLSPDQLANIRAGLGDWANRGLGYSGPAMLDQATRRTIGGEQMLRQRQQFAQSVLQNNQAIVGDPFLQILGRQGSALGTAAGVQGGAGAQIFNPESSLAGSIAAGNQQMNAMFAGPSTMGKIGQVTGAIGNLAGSY